jgi:hypothetical protein
MRQGRAAPASRNSTESNVFKFVRPKPATDTLDIELPGVAPTWNTPVQYEADLVARLTVQHDELDALFATAVAQIKKDPAAAERCVRDCADWLHKLRHTEALRLYPVIARGLSPEPIQRRLFWQSRLVMLGLARRILRRFDDLAQAIHSHRGISAAIDHAAGAMTEYRRRNETTMYPLYNRVGQRRSGANSRVA